MLRSLFPPAGARHHRDPIAELIRLNARVRFGYEYGGRWRRPRPSLDGVLTVAAFTTAPLVLWYFVFRAGAALAALLK